MAPGSFNGHNFGGLHTGTGKYNQAGPYAHNGYRHQTISHKYYKPGLDVLYLGNHKNSAFVPHGSHGVILEKDTRTKVSRTMIRVDFKEYGIRYVYKKNLYLKGFCDFYINSVLQTTQPHKNEMTERMKRKMSEKKVKLLMKSRDKRKEFRKARKELNDTKKSEIDVFMEYLYTRYGSNPISLLLEKKTYVGMDNQYSRDYSKYMKLIHKTMTPNEIKEPSRVYSVDQDISDIPEPTNITRKLWGLS